MKKNVGTVDRVIRAVVAAVAAYLGYSVNAWFYLLAVIALITAALGTCGIYDLMGISTAKKKK